MKLKLERKPARIELIPLVDIIFLLLVFFIYSMLSMAVYRGIPVMLPAAESVEDAKQEALFITVDKEGKVYVDKALTPVDGLLERLRAEHIADPAETAIISADGDAPYGVFVDVLDKVRIAGFQKVSIEARPEAAPPQ
jgi:biopolymer transport protein ExbD